jgi:hypothetical protein
MVLLQHEVYLKVKIYKTTTLTQALKPITTYEIALERACLKMEIHRETNVAKRLKEWNNHYIPKREPIVWSWHPLYYMCATILLLATKLFKLPWSHSAAKHIRYAVFYVGIGFHLSFNQRRYVVFYFGRGFHLSLNQQRLASSGCTYS